MCSHHFQKHAALFDVFQRQCSLHGALVLLNMPLLLEHASLRLCVVQGGRGTFSLTSWHVHRRLKLWLICAFHQWLFCPTLQKSAAVLKKSGALALGITASALGSSFLPSREVYGTKLQPSVEYIQISRILIANNPSHQA